MALRGSSVNMRAPLRMEGLCQEPLMEDFSVIAAEIRGCWAGI